MDHTQSGRKIDKILRGRFRERGEGWLPSDVILHEVLSFALCAVRGRREGGPGPADALLR